MLHFIRRELAGIYPGENLTPRFIRLKKEMEEILKDEFERQALNHFDFITWLESKITGRTFAEILREKAEKKDE